MVVLWSRGALWERYRAHARRVPALHRHRRTAAEVTACAGKLSPCRRSLHFSPATPAPPVRRRLHPISSRCRPGRVGKATSAQPNSSTRTAWPRSSSTGMSRRSSGSTGSSSPAASSSSMPRAGALRRKAASSAWHSASKMRSPTTRCTFARSIFALPIR